MIDFARKEAELWAEARRKVIDYGRYGDPRDAKRCPRCGDPMAFNGCVNQFEHEDYDRWFGEKK